MDRRKVEKSDLLKKPEWISLVYLLFFVLAVLSPSLVRNGYFGIPEEHVEEVLIFIFGISGLMVVSLFERMMEKRLKERDEAVTQSERAVKELLESYKYIGSVNRQIDVLKTLVNQTSLSIVGSEAYEKDLMKSIMSNAAVSVNAKGVLVRFIELEKLRTDREYYHESLNGKPLKVANKELRNLHQYGSTHAFMRTEDGREILAIPSDRKDSSIKAYLLLLVDAGQVTDIEISLLKVFANQAELVYHQLINKRGEPAEAEPLKKVDDVAKMSLGEVS